MTALHLLWLPIVLSSVFVFLVSFVLHMLLPWHKHDFRPVPNEEKVLDALRPFGLPPGDYFAPRCEDMKDMKSPEFTAKLDKGPVFVATILPNGRTSMGRSMLLWFVYLVAISLLSASVAWHALHRGGSYPDVFRFIGTAAFLGYAGAHWQQTIWWHRSLGTTIRNTIDALIYAGVAAGTFGWLWPR